MTPPRIRHALKVLAGAALVAALSPAAAFGSHEKGGSLTAAVTADGRLQGTLTYLTAGSCTAGAASGSKSLTVKSPAGTTQSANTEVGTYTRCLANSATMRARFDIDLAATFAGAAPDGAYEVTFSSCCRVDGIMNTTTPATMFVARVTKRAGVASSAPAMNSDVTMGIAKGYEYRQGLNAFDPDGGPIVYQSLAGLSGGPETDVITLSNSGIVSIPAATTATFLNRQTYVYKVRATDDEGDYGERDVLLTVTDQNAPPSITGLDTEQPYAVAAGATRVVEFEATDPNNAAPKIDTVSILAGELPAWATLEEITPGNPARYRLTLAPPAGTAPQTVAVNLDAVDSDTVVPMIGSATIILEVSAPAPVAPAFLTSPAAVSATTSLTWEMDQDLSYECSVDGGDWAPCTSPWDPALVDGAHTVSLRAVGPGGPSPAVSHSWTVDTWAPDAPQVVSGPLGRVASGQAVFEFTGEPGATFECRLDEGEWTACTSPMTYRDLAKGTHAFAVRQTDAAGNRSTATVNGWEVVAEAVATPAATAKKVTAVMGSSVAVNAATSSAMVGCRLDAGELASCKVAAFVRDPRTGRLIEVGSGTVKGRDGQRRAAVSVKLNARGRRYLARAGGVRVVFKVTASSRGGETVRTSRPARLLPDRVMVVPANGLFAPDSSALSPQGLRYLRGVAKRLGKPRSVECAGHTDSLGDASYNARLGLTRAQMVCATLRSLGVRSASRATSAGEARPRATNLTAVGRALNRRVELVVSYR
jgi:outer membrane protein OmpA-like peptidoglycan-associated protein